MVIDVPHLRERTCNDRTNATSVLTVDNFQSSDNGTYQCRAVDGNNSGYGDRIELRGLTQFYNNIIIASSGHAQKS